MLFFNVNDELKQIAAPQSRGADGECELRHVAESRHYERLDGEKFSMVIVYCVSKRPAVNKP